jgi:hypothetical protein
MKTNPSISKIGSVVGGWFSQCRKNVPLAGLMLLAAGSAGAADSSAAATNSIADFSLEELANIQVTSVTCDFDLPHRFALENVRASFGKRVAVVWPKTPLRTKLNAESSNRSVIKR